MKKHAKNKNENMSTDMEITDISRCECLKMVAKYLSIAFVLLFSTVAFVKVGNACPTGQLPPISNLVAVEDDYDVLLSWSYDDPVVPQPYYTVQIYRDSTLIYYNITSIIPYSFRDHMPGPGEHSYQVLSSNIAEIEVNTFDAPLPAPTINYVNGGTQVGDYDVIVIDWDYDCANYPGKVVSPTNYYGYQVSYNAGIYGYELWHSTNGGQSWSRDINQTQYGCGGMGAVMLYVNPNSPHLFRVRGKCALYGPNNESYTPYSEITSYCSPFATTIPELSTNVISTLDADNITLTSAKLSGHLVDADINPANITFYYDTVDGESDEQAWENSAIGTLSATTGDATLDVTGLQSGTKYYFRGFADNCASSMWAEESQAFTTLAIPEPVAWWEADGVRVAWTDWAGKTDLTDYLNAEVKVYRRTHEINDDFVNYTQLNSGTVLLGDDSYVDTTAVSGQDYDYLIEVMLPSQTSLGYSAKCTVQPIGDCQETSPSNWVQ